MPQPSRQVWDADDEFVRFPGLFRKWELQELIVPGNDYRIESAGETSDGTPLFAVHEGGLAEVPADDGSPGAAGSAAKLAAGVA